MKKRLFIVTTLILCAGLCCFFAASVYVTYTNNLSFAKDMVIETAQICAALYRENADISTLEHFGGSTRVTVVALDGRVLADSRPVDVDELENHLNRPEIQASENGTPEAFVRHSDTLGADLIYYALKVDTGGGTVYIRAAVPVAKIDTYLLRSLPLLAVLLIVVALLCFFFTRRSVGRIVTPFGAVEQNLRQLLGGVYKSEPITASYEEIDVITREIDGVAGLLQDSINALRDEKEKLDYILQNIGDGLFAVDENRNISLINAAAHNIFGVTPDISGKKLEYLTYDKTLSRAVEDCVTHKKSVLFEWSSGGRIYLVTAKPLCGTSLTIVVMSDVTESRENAKQREEFFANASHELKTPLTAIKGFNELTALNNKDESIGKYIVGITRETDRMLSLIGDMLKLSELENTMDISTVSVSLAKVIREVWEALTPAIEAKAIVFNTSGDDAVTAEPGHVYELIKNLIENAVRYNNYGGNVTVTIGKRTLTVGDNGIGIAPEEQARIFERFYRVEKSRSERGGGTGLGLSIVKHVCVIYGWKLTLKSKLGVGTEVKVEF